MQPWGREQGQCGLAGRASRTSIMCMVLRPSILEVTVQSTFLRFSLCIMVVAPLLVMAMVAVLALKVVR